MPKYKYVDGVKYRVVPQSVLGYALVREDSDNSLPAGGTEGQVLTKASNTDYDVEWATVESGGGNSDWFIVDYGYDAETQSYLLDDPTKRAEYYNNLEAGMLPILRFNVGVNAFVTMPSLIEKDIYEGSSEYTVTTKDISVAQAGVTMMTREFFINSSEYSINADTVLYPSAE